MNFSIDIHHTEKVWTLDLPSKIGFSIFTFCILGFGIIVQRQLIKFLQYMKTRPVNQIIYKNLTLQNIFYPPLLVWILFDIWEYKLGHIFGEVGCGIYIYAGLFISHHDRAHSLFINLFRYTCIVKEESMRHNEILPKVSIFPSVSKNVKVTSLTKYFEIFCYKFIESVSEFKNQNSCPYRFLLGPS